MIFSNFVKSEVDNLVTFKNSIPIQNVGSIKFYKDNSSGSFSKKEFRWSFNKDYWSSWETLNQGKFTNINTKGNPCIYIEIRYILANTSSKVTSFSLDYIDNTT